MLHPLPARQIAPPPPPIHNQSFPRPAPKPAPHRPITGKSPPNSPRLRPETARSEYVQETTAERFTHQDTGSHPNLSLSATSTSASRAAAALTRALAWAALLVLAVGTAVILIPLALVAVAIVGLYAASLFLAWLIRSRLERWGLVHPASLERDIEGREGVRVVRAASPTPPGE